MYEAVEYTPKGNAVYNRTYHIITKRTGEDGSSLCDTQTVHKTIHLDDRVLVQVKSSLLDTINKLVDFNILKSYLIPVSKKQVRKVYKNLRKRNMVFGKLEKENLKVIMSFNGLEKYCNSLRKEFKSEGFVTDYTNYLFIDIISIKDKQSIGAKFDFAYDNGKLIKIWINGSDTSYHRLYDPSILFRLGDYIPSNAMISNYFTKTAFLNDYIVWYFEELYKPR